VLLDPRSYAEQRQGIQAHVTTGIPADVVHAAARAGRDKARDGQQIPPAVPGLVLVRRAGQVPGLPLAAARLAQGLGDVLGVDAVEVQVRLTVACRVPRSETAVATCARARLHAVGIVRTGDACCGAGRCGTTRRMNGMIWGIFALPRPMSHQDSEIRISLCIFATSAEA
jgi:hypothetical protein